MSLLASEVRRTLLHYTDGSGSRNVRSPGAAWNRTGVGCEVTTELVEALVIALEREYRLGSPNGALNLGARDCKFTRTGRNEGEIRFGPPEG